MWPTFGLLLSSRRFLLATAYADGVFGPAVSRVGDFYLLQDVVTYWGHNALTGEVFVEAH